jgi:type IV secretory pathway TrbL component
MTGPRAPLGIKLLSVFFAFGAGVCLITIIALLFSFRAPAIIDWFAIALRAPAFIAMLRYKIHIAPVVLASGLFGLLLRFAISR